VINPDKNTLFYLFSHKEKKELSTSVVMEDNEDRFAMAVLELKGYCEGIGLPYCLSEWDICQLTVTPRGEDDETSSRMMDPTLSSSPFPFALDEA